jgi:hypothetical protein
MTPRLGDVVRIRDGDPDARYFWKHWWSLSDEVLLIHLETGEILNEYARNLVMIETETTLVKDPTLESLRAELERIGVMGRIKTIALDDNPIRGALAVITHLPTLTLYDLTRLRGYFVCDGDKDWKAIKPQVITPSPVLNAGAAGQSVALTPDEALADIIGPEPDAEDDDLDDTPDDVDAPSDSPLPEGEGLGVRDSDTEGEHLPPGKPQPDDVRDRVMDADHSAAPDDKVAYLSPSKEIDLLEAQLRAANHRAFNLEQRNEELADKLDLINRQNLYAPVKPVVERKLDMQTLYQENLQDPIAREFSDKELRDLVIAGWSVEHEQIVVVSTTVIRVIRLQRWSEPEVAPQPTATAFVDAIEALDLDADFRPLDADTHRAVYANDASATAVRIIGLHEPEVSVPLSQPYSAFGRGERGEGEPTSLQQTIATLDAQAYQAGAAAVAAFRKAQPPTFTAIPRALPAPV